jgi:hypothetical protein
MCVVQNGYKDVFIKHLLYEGLWTCLEKLLLALLAIILWASLEGLSCGQVGVFGIYPTNIRAHSGCKCSIMINSIPISFSLYRTSGTDLIASSEYSFLQSIPP